MKRILFILKKRHGYGGDGYAQSFPSGLNNSARFVVDMLNEEGFKAHLVQVEDNNSIDKEVTKFRPDTVVIEALWVVPEKFKILRALHPRVKWIVRIHSDVPFLANEGIAVEWLKAYVTIPHVYVATNSIKGFNDIRTIVSHSPKILLLPNFYPIIRHQRVNPRTSRLDVGCFGAIRPMKNQLEQAVAAIKYGDELIRGGGKGIRFHINGTREEMGGNAVLKNLRSLFANTDHMLAEHEWLTHHDFLRTMRMMDVSLSVSFSETFCIVAADAVSQGVPIVVSEEVPWAVGASQVDTTKSKEIIKGMKTALRWAPILNLANRISLNRYSERSREIWVREL